MGAQLELSTPLRDAMFTAHSRPRRKHTTTELFWAFVAACRDALDRLQAEQISLAPSLRCPERPRTGEPLEG
jgi:Poly-gamma-glutamate hydrolase